MADSSPISTTTRLTGTHPPTRPVQNWNDTWQVQNCELAGLATFNEHNVDYRRYVMSAMKAWLDKGVDALRVDTVKHMPLWFWQEFTSEMNSHKPDLFMFFGEWIYSHPGNAEALDFANHSGMSILDFAVCMAIRDALGHRAESGFLAIDTVFAMDAKYRSATELVTFFDNHDMPRLLSIGADSASLRLATILILTARGIPCIYYGTEQYLHDDTNGGGDPFNRPDLMEKFDTKLAAAFSDVKNALGPTARQYRGQFGSQREAHYLTPDIYAYGRRHRDARCFADRLEFPRRSDVRPNITTDLPDDDYTCVLTGLTRHRAPRRDRRARKAVASDALVLCRHGRAVRGGDAVAHNFQINGCATTLGDTVAVIGDCPELGEWDTAKELSSLEYVNDNLWQTDVPFSTSLRKARRLQIRRPPRRDRRRSAPSREVEPSGGASFHTEMSSNGATPGGAMEFTRATATPTFAIGTAQIRTILASHRRTDPVIVVYASRRRAPKGRRNRRALRCFVERTDGEWSSRWNASRWVSVAVAATSASREIGR